MRIVIDMQGAQTQSRYRGIGRYTISLAKAIASDNKKHEIILALSGLFPETILQIKEEFANIVGAEKIVVWNAPGPISGGPSHRRKVAELLREEFLERLNPDFILITSHFEGYSDDAITTINTRNKNTEIAVIVYDLIPLIYPELYIAHDRQYEDYYISKVRSLEGADLILTISNSSRCELIENIKFDADNIVNISAGYDENFAPLNLSENEILEIRKKFQIKNNFILYVGGYDERKNIKRLIEAYSMLPNFIRDRKQLVLAGKMSVDTEIKLKNLINTINSARENIVILNYVSDYDLVRLYNICELYVFPSWHEGFGLPALEAMACGAAVLGANTSSLPEVIGNQDALFNPYRSEDIRNKLFEFMVDESKKNILRKNGLKQSQKFSWASVANALMATIENKKGKRKLNSRGLTEEDAYRRLISDLSSSLSGVSDKELFAIARCIELNRNEIV